MTKETFQHYLVEAIIPIGLGILVAIFVIAVSTHTPTTDHDWSYYNKCEDGYIWQRQQNNVWIKDYHECKIKNENNNDTRNMEGKRD